jgi:GTPase SAR1 family protein
MYDLCLFDSSGLEDYDRIRTLIYSQTGVFVICVNMEKKWQVERVEEMLIPEITHHCPSVPYILVDATDSPEEFHTHSKLQINPMERKAHGKALARRIGACKYVHCNLHTAVGVKAALDEVTTYLL